MKILLLALVAISVAGSARGAGNQTSDADVLHILRVMQHELETLKESMKDTIGGLSRQMMLQQMFHEERVKSDGTSGLKHIRAGVDVTKPYFSNTFASGSVAAIHDHANYDRTVGMGELNVVLNGIDFRTRHNDYKLMMPTQSKDAFEHLEPVPFPDVPPSVLAKPTVQEQINEMRQYFRAFHLQDPKIRDYNPYFKPVMCYLEGGWMSDAEHIHEPFHSDRHFIDAKDLRDLQDKMMYMAQSGGKNIFENISYLPKGIINVTIDGKPVYVQWNYRIACHPVKERMYLKDFALVDDLATRMRFKWNMTRLGHSKAARFSLPYRHGYGYNKADNYGKHAEGGSPNGLIDKIMYEIPGKDNYMGNLTDDTFSALKYQAFANPLETLNVARYHRMYKQNRAGAMGLTIRHRGFSDQNLYVAKTSSPQIASLEMTNCEKDRHTHKDVCTRYEGRHTYAIPLEIIWLTPLYEWNPYNLTFYSDNRRANVVTAGGRNGQFNQAKAFNGTSFRQFYRTPTEFFRGGEVGRDPADTAKDFVGVLDPEGHLRKVSASGTRIFLPEISGLGKMRMRYPVMPTHNEGSVNYKNLLALQDIVMDMKKYTRMFETKPEIKDVTHAPDHFKTSVTHADPPGMHDHDVYLTEETMSALHRNTTVTVFTSEDNGHQHELEVKLDPVHSNKLIIVSCDGQATCWDKHDHFLYQALL